MQLELRFKAFVARDPSCASGLARSIRPGKSNCLVLRPSFYFHALLDFDVIVELFYFFFDLLLYLIDAELAGFDKLRPYAISI